MNRPAIERLLGGDSELEVELRQQIADQFATKHLKSLLNDKVFNQFRKTVSAEVDSAIHDCLARTTKRGWKREVSINAEVREKLREAVRAETENVFRGQISDAIDAEVEKYKRFAENRLRAALKDAFSEQKINELIDAGVQQRLELAASFGKHEKEERSIDLT